MTFPPEAVPAGGNHGIKPNRDPGRPLGSQRRLSYKSGRPAAPIGIYKSVANYLSNGQPLGSTDQNSQRSPNDHRANFIVLCASERPRDAYEVNGRYIPGEYLSVSMTNSYSGQK